MKHLLFIFFLIFSSCGADDEDLVDLAVESANTYLTVGDCQSAIDELEEVGRQSKHAGYVKTFASAYACRAGYTTSTFFETDSAKIGTPSTLGGFAAFTTSSSMDDPQNQSYLDIQTALDFLLYSGGLNTALDPTMTRRALVFTDNDVGDINAYIMYLTMVQLGKYLYFYGNSDALGEKGAGVAGNTCLASYKNVGYSVGDTDTTLAALPAGNSCVASGAGVGNAYLGTLNALNAQRLCQGITLLNNFIHVMPTVIAEIGAGDLGLISTLEALFNTARSTMVSQLPASVEFSTILSQSKCETLAAVTDPVTDNLEAYFIHFIEALFE